MYQVFEFNWYSILLVLKLIEKNIFILRTSELFHDHDFALNFSIGYIKTGFTVHLTGFENEFFGC